MKAPQRGSNDRSLAAPTLVPFRRRLVQCHNRVRFLTEALHERSGRCGASAVVTAGSDRSPATNSAVIFRAHISHRRNTAAEIPCSPQSLGCVGFCWCWFTRLCRVIGLLHRRENLSLIF